MLSRDIETLVRQGRASLEDEIAPADVLCEALLRQLEAMVDRARAMEACTVAHHARQTAAHLPAGVVSLAAWRGVRRAI